MVATNRAANPPLQARQSAQRVAVLASRWDRLWAYAVDALLVLVPLLSMSWAYMDEVDNLSEVPAEIRGGLFIYEMLLLVVQSILLTKDGQTIGKKLFKVRIVKVNTETNGGFLPNVVLRTLLPLILCVLLTYISPIILIIDNLFIFREDKRCLHDLIARTHVVKSIEYRCPNCQYMISMGTSVCPSCKERLSPKTQPVTQEKIEDLLSQLDRSRLALPPESYLHNAQIYAQNRQMEKATLELGKVLLVATPESDVYKQAQKLLTGLGYRF